MSRGRRGAAQPCGKAQVVPNQTQEHHQRSCSPQDRQDPGDSGEKGVISITVLLQDRAAVVIIKADPSQSGEAAAGDAGAHDRVLALFFPDMLDITLRRIHVAGGGRHIPGYSPSGAQGPLLLRRRGRGAEWGSAAGSAPPATGHSGLQRTAGPGEPPHSQHRQDQQN